MYFVETLFGQVLKFCAQSDETVKVGIESATANFVPAWAGYEPTTKTRQQGPDDHDRTPQGSAEFFELRALQEIQINGIGLELVMSACYSG